MPRMITLRLLTRWLLGLLFVAAGVNHFRRPEFYAAIVPPYLPAPLTLVIVSGVFEVLLGLLLLVPATSRLAAWGLIALLVAVFPANVHMALYPDQFPQFPPAALWGRLPVQGVLVAWAWWYTRPGRGVAVRGSHP